MPSLVWRLLLACAPCLGPAPRVSAGPQAVFLLRLAPHETDAVLDLSDPWDQTLDLEVWVQITGVAAGVRATAFSVFLNAGDDGVVSADAGFTSPPFVFGCAAAGADNEPDSGDIGRVCVNPVGTTEGIDGPALWGQFSVSAAGPGTMSYAFADAGAVRAWRISLSNGTTLQGPALTGILFPPVENIEVLDFSISADADGDGDVDLSDYAAFARCVPAIPAPATGACRRFDLEPDGFVTRDDLDLFVTQLTGPACDRQDCSAGADVARPADPRPGAMLENSLEGPDEEDPAEKSPS